jgi:ACS family D-galactonate transporter-like MFS transporter
MIVANEPSQSVSEDLTGGRLLAQVSRPGIVPLFMTISLISHFNRISISTAGDTRIMKQYEIDPVRMGMVYSAFLFAYTTFMIPGGLLIDRFGARIALMVVLFGSAMFVALTGAVGLSFTDPTMIFLALLAVRGLMGMFSAPLHPGLARAVSHWVRPGAQSRTNGLVNGGALLGIALTPMVFGTLIDRFDWPRAFLIAAGITALVGLFWSFYARERTPLEDVPENATLESEIASNPGDWFDLLRHRSLLLLTISYGTIGYFQYMFFYWMNYYFETVLHLDVETSRFYAAIPPLAMAVGMPLGGWIADHMEHSRGRSWGRKVVTMVGMSMGAALLIAGVYAHEPMWIVAWFALALGAVGMAEGPSWATAIDLGGRRGGSAAALFNTGGNAGGILAPIITPWIGQRLDWGYAVALGSLICVFGVSLWFWVDPHEKPVY